MILFVAAQDLRTPLGFIEWMGWCEQTIPAMLERVMQDSIKKMEEAIEKGIKLKLPSVRNEFTGLIKVTTEPPANPAMDRASLRAEVTIGRRSWIASMRHLLTGIAKKLSRHRWSVAEPADGFEWPITDHPVLRLNYYATGKYDFKGGWGQPGTQIMMPVSPRHLLYVQVGQNAANRLTFDPNLTGLIQRFLIERAHRWVFATHPAEWVVRGRPRTVDSEIYTAEKKMWQDFHPDQLRSETSSKTD